MLRIKKLVLKEGFERYESIIGRLQNISFPGCAFPEINVFLYSINSEYLVIKSTPKFFQVSSNVYNDGKDWWELNESAPKD